MLNALKGMVASKKAVAMIVGIIMASFGKKMGLDEDALTKIIGVVASYCIGQGIADHGKEAAKIG